MESPAKKSVITKMGHMLDRALYVARQRAIGQISDGQIPIVWDDQRTRLNFINDLIHRYSYKSYLEIGCRDDSTFAHVNTPSKVGVDPVSGGTHRCTSDKFFEANKEHFDIIFIDGLHTYEQVRIDVINALEVLNEGGSIVMHDCLPLNAWAQLDRPVIDNWNGDVWKAFVEIRTWNHVDALVCIIDEGVGLLRKRANQEPLSLVSNFKSLKFSALQQNYATWLRPVPYEQALQFGD